MTADDRTDYRRTMTDIVWADMGEISRAKLTRIRSAYRAYLIATGRGV